MKTIRMPGLLAVAMLCLALCGCGRSSGEATAVSASAAEKEIAGDVYDTGVFSVLVPTGWKAFPGVNIWGDDESDKTDPELLYVFKGAKEELDMLNTCGLTISHAGPEASMTDGRSTYTKVEDLSPITVGDVVWTAFRAVKSFGENDEWRYTVLTTGEEGQDRFLVTILEENGGEMIGVADAEVQAVLKSIRKS